MDTHTFSVEKPIVGYRQLAEFLTSEGFPISRSTIAKYCAPAVNIGPPVESYWIQSPTFLPSRAIAWAKARLRPVSAVRAEPSGRGRPRKRAAAQPEPASTAAAAAT